MDKEFAALSPKQFVKNYLVDFGAKLVVAGFDFTYGYNGEGNMDCMMMDSNGILNVIQVGKIEFEGKKVSSTIIRNLIHSGKVEQIPSYLGEPYQIEGTVLLNKENVDVHIFPYYLLPASGIYQVTISNGFETCKQKALVQNGTLKLLELDNSLSDYQVVRVYWQKKLTKGLLQSMDQEQFTLKSMVY